MLAIPDRTEAAEYYFTYIDKVPRTDVRAVIESQASETPALFESPLPSFDQNVAIATAGADDRSWSSHIEEFQAIRAASVAFFRNLPADAWTRRGVASGNPFTVRALAYIVAGHLAHHVKVLQERYL